MTPSTERPTPADWRQGRRSAGKKRARTTVTRMSREARTLTTLSVPNATHIRLRFCATVGREPEAELTLLQPLCARSLLAALRLQVVLRVRLERVTQINPFGVCIPLRRGV